MVFSSERWRRLEPDLAQAIKRRAMEKTEDGKFIFKMPKTNEPEDDSSDWI